MLNTAESPVLLETIEPQQCNDAVNFFLVSQYYLNLCNIRNGLAEPNSPENQSRFIAVCYRWFVWNLLSPSDSGEYLDPEQTVDWYMRYLEEFGYHPKRIEHPFLDSIEGITVPVSVRLPMGIPKARIEEAVYEYRPKTKKTNNELGFLCKAFEKQRGDYPELFSDHVRQRLVVPRNVLKGSDYPNEFFQRSDLTVLRLSVTIGEFKEQVI